MPSRSASTADPAPVPSAASLRRATALLASVALLSAGCRSPVTFYRPGHGPSGAPVIALGAPAPFVSTPPGAGLPDGPGQDAAGVYAGTTGPSSLAESLRHLPQRVYVPDSLTGGVTVLDAQTLRPVGSLRATPRGPVQLTAAPDLRELWLNDTTHGAVVSLPPEIERPGGVPPLPTAGPSPTASTSPATKPKTARTPAPDVTSGPRRVPATRPHSTRSGTSGRTIGPRPDSGKRGTSPSPSLNTVRPRVTRQGADTRTPNSTRPRPTWRDPGSGGTGPSGGRSDDGVLSPLLSSSTRGTSGGMRGATPVLLSTRTSGTGEGMSGATPVLLGTHMGEGMRGATPLLLGTGTSGAATAAPMLLGADADAEVRAFTRRLPEPGTLYFAPDDTQAALVVSARGRQVDVRSAASGGWTTIPLPCAGSSADFSADASSLAVSCAAARRLVLLDPRRGVVEATRALPAGSRPSGVRLLPDGSQFAVADAGSGGVRLLDARDFRNARFVRTSPGASALVLSRDARSLYVVGPSEVTVLDVASRRVAAHWRVPGDGALAAGGVSVDGRTLWLTRPSAGMLIALDTRTGAADRTVRLGGHPAAPLPFPQPGRRALGGPGIYR